MKALFIKVNCGKKICGKCEKRTEDICDIFNKKLSTWVVTHGLPRWKRLQECLEAECRLIQNMNEYMNELDYASRWWPSTKKGE